jgi:hypothetical protein
MPEKIEKCFIIMPMTTPEHLHTTYRDGKDHFQHVLECLFVPAVEKAGFLPERPIAQGADLIQAEIVKWLESSEMVLCDISTLNPNVFFEFGMRTSFNKPICVVKDELVTKIPFDTAILNCQDYDSSIDPWRLENEINKLAEHIKLSRDRSKGENPFWKYLGIKSEVTLQKTVNDPNLKMDYLINQFQALRIQLIDRTEYTPKIVKQGNLKPDVEDLIWDVLKVQISEGAILVELFPPNENGVVVATYRGNMLSSETIESLSNLIVRTYRRKIEFRHIT